MNATKVYRLPPVFVTDHINRDLLDHTAIIGWSGNYAKVQLDDDQWRELLSDAEHYACDGGGFDSEYRGLMRSAAATVTALMKQGTP